MIALVVGVLVIWLLLVAFRRFEATALGGLVCAGVLVYSFGWPVLVLAAVAAFVQWRIQYALKR